MALTDAWRQLHRSHFSDLPLDCGNLHDPGVHYSEDMRDWSRKATTEDQARMERYLDRFDLSDKRVLHIGIGNSGFAQRFHRRTGEIVGTTIDDPEIEVARSKSISNYAAVLHNKYSGRDDAVPSQFHFIMDNNPTTACCCIRHLSNLFDFYVERLAKGGLILTDTSGLRWIPDDVDKRWSFDFDDLAAVANVAGLSTYRVTKHVCVLSRSVPPSPGLKARSRHVARRVAALPGRIVKGGPAAVVRIVKVLAKKMMPSTAPGTPSSRSEPK